MKRIKIGDLFEIQTKKGLAYFQYVYEDKAPPRFGSLIRIFPGIYSERPSGFEKMVKDQELYYTYFLLKPAHKEGMVELLGNYDVPERFKTIPPFKHPGIPNRETKKPMWWGVDMANGRKRFEELPPEFYGFSTKALWNPAMLIER